ncbi:acetyl-CoA carboxylase, carboxyltransferase subunit beta [Paenibacillus sp. FSL H7-0942]|uniref:Acetyl-coenzyme A carboxylase carboxyl transferase subunit beta n=2 Tax=Paenibacillus TaxID=44249 RepID=A0A117I0J7_PAEAM|nr:MULTISPECIES: acetyl-CoA carboxylase, carboxyltransferase subunit beta [Paenibacillus]MBD8838333.1 acetyl-CoA carboxylase carboxyltransferase subunit beta [Paenibacillus sp. CFBP 13594]MCP1183270.1 acetyl-CoA carboxylase, carboxyltransferase subunit beta [Paenibacillus sp. 1781tsa1]NMI02809.1 acetyl-CoA carboxylase carboxyltransferase subunit beta [Paenibacillus sp. SZ31]APO44922.1 acetyl-CoA carboxylase subunit beta [Paenibacillus xylanexedens]ETT36779.1 acetyl-coenzyme A carboxylase carbo
MFKDIFQKKRKYATIPSERALPGEGQEVLERPKREIPEGLMNKCSKCGTIQYSKELEKNLKVCPACGYHMRLNAMERIAMVLDDQGFVEFDADMISVDPLGFPGYSNKLEQQRLKSGLKEAVITGEGTIDGLPVVVAVMSFDFFTGSMGSVVGEKITRAIEHATEKRLPLIIFSTSGGARMQESILSLMQMAKTSAALSRLDEQGGLYISVITDPTTGGVSASFASLGDINIAEPGAVFGFAGRIVIEQTIRQKLPDDFQTAEFNMQHGQLDMVVHRKELRATLGKLLDMHSEKGGV